MQIKKRIAGFAIVLVLIFLLSACSPSSPKAPPLTPVTLQLQWTHQAQFAGFYAADQNGYFRDEGIDITFVEGAPGDDISPVTDGTTQFGIGGADELILARANGAPVKAIFTIYRRSPIVFISPKEKGITRPEQFAGQKIRVTTNAIATLHAMTARVGLTPDDYTEVILPSDVNLFLSGEAPVWSAYLDGFVLTLQRAGYELNIIYPDDYGVHFYADTLFTTDATIQENPDLVLRFLRASIKGWNYALENPSETGKLVTHYKPDANPEVENARLAVMVPLVNTGEDSLGWMRPEIWAGMEQTMREQNVLLQPLSIESVYTLEFLNTLTQQKKMQ